MRLRISLAILVFVATCCKRYAWSKEEAAFAARPRNYQFEHVEKDSFHDERWHFANTPTIWETNERRRTETVNRALASIGWPAVTNAGVRVGRISEMRGGWIYYRWPNYPLGTLHVTFVEEYGMQPGQVRVSFIEQPSNQ